MKQAISTQQLEDAYDAYGAAVYRLAVSFLGQYADAEDVTQETFCRLLYRAPAFAETLYYSDYLLDGRWNIPSMPCSITWTQKRWRPVRWHRSRCA